jgi:hypothetical protein
MIPTSRRGETYSGQVHITDWVPSLLNIATDKQWKGSYKGLTIDGVDVWDAIIKNEASPRKEIVFYVADDSAVIQYDMMKYTLGFPPVPVNLPRFTWDHDLQPGNAYMACDITDMEDASYGTIYMYSSMTLDQILSTGLRWLIILTMILFVILIVTRACKYDKQYMIVKLFREVNTEEKFQYDDDDEELLPIQSRI